MRQQISELAAVLANQRAALSAALHDLSEAQARARPSASALSLAGLVKHAAAMERVWILGAIAGLPVDRPDPETWHLQFEPDESETVPALLAGYRAVAEQTERVLAEVTDLDAPSLLPPSPWVNGGRPVSKHYVLLHLVEEGARHAGHADIIRESLDGAQSHEVLGRFAAAA